MNMHICLVVNFHYNVVDDYIYIQDLSTPIACYDFPAALEFGGVQGDYSFVSSVCWKGNGTTMVAANSRGAIRVLSLGLSL